MAENNAPVVVAMAPIPNPPGASRYERRRAWAEEGYARAPAHRRHREAPETYGEAAPPVRHARTHHAYAAAPAPAAHAYVPPPAPKALPRPVAPSVASAAHQADIAARAAAAAAAVKAQEEARKAEAAARAAQAKAAQDAKAAAAKVAADAKAAKDKAAAAAKLAASGAAPKLAAPVTPQATPSTASAGADDRVQHLKDLQAALTAAVAKQAVLKKPVTFTAGQPADVSLSLPAGFAETVRDAAAKTGLTDAAASVNLTAILSGDGYTAVPDETQSQPLTVGQPVEFHWTVTAAPNAKGPLHADVGADLLGAGSDSLALGSVQGAAKGGFHLTPQVLGAALLVLIVAVLVAWLSSGRNSGPTRSAAARRAARRMQRDRRPANPDGGAEVAH